MNQRQLALVKSVAPAPVLRLLYRYEVAKRARWDRKNRALVDWCYAKQQAASLYMTGRITSEEHNALANYADKVLKHRRHHNWRDS